MDVAGAPVPAARGGAKARATVPWTELVRVGCVGLLNWKVAERAFGDKETGVSLSGDFTHWMAAGYLRDGIGLPRLSTFKLTSICPGRNA